VDKQAVTFSDWGRIAYSDAWQKQEELLSFNVGTKISARQENIFDPFKINTENHLVFCEHPPVFTLGKSGDISHLLIAENMLKQKGIEFYKTNRGGDITFHGPEQIVGYPILDLEKFSTDIGLFLRNIEEVIIRTLNDYGIKGQRSSGETGVWIEPESKINARKICAIGVRCSRWVTMHGFAFNINTDLSYFDMIVPCGIQNKKVTSLEKELGKKISVNEVKVKLIKHFADLFNAEII